MKEIKITDIQEAREAKNNDAADVAAYAADYVAAYAAAYAAAADVAAYAADYVAAYAAAKANRKQTADICRQVFGEAVISLMNEAEKQGG